MINIRFARSFALLFGAFVVWLPGAFAEANDVELGRDLVRQVTQCWLGVEDLPQPWRLKIIIGVSMNGDGSLASEPVLIAPTDVDPADKVMSIAIRRALNAVTDCAPFALKSNTYVWPQQTNFHFFSPTKPIVG